MGIYLNLLEFFKSCNLTRRDKISHAGEIVKGKLFLEELFIR